MSSSAGLLARQISALIARKVDREPDAIVDLLRRDDVDIGHLREAIGHLKEQAAECDMPSAALATWRRLDRIFGYCIDRTSLLHEWVLETSARGFVEIDADGAMIHANSAFRELVPGWHGTELIALFPDHERAFIRDALAGRGGARLLRRMEIETGSGLVPVSVEFGPLAPGPARQGGYALIGNIDVFLRAERKAFAASDIGVIRTDRRSHQIRFANPSAATLLGRSVAELEGTDPTELITQASRDRLVTAMDRIEKEGRSEEIELDYIRPDGTTAPVHLTIYPEINELGVRTGTLTELRSLVERDAVQAISDAVGSHASSAGLFAAVLDEIRKIVPFDGASLYAYSDDMQFARAVFTEPPPPEQTLQWWPVNDIWRAWIAGADPLIEDLAAEMRANAADPAELERFEVAWYLKEGFVAWAAVPLLTGKGVRLALFLAAKQRRFYNRQHLEMLRRAGVHRALEALSGTLDRERTQFLFDLGKALQAAENSREAAQLLVSRLAAFYRWPNVSVFKVNRVRKRFELLAQARGPKGYLLPSGHSLPLTDGVLGQALRTGQAQILNNARDPEEPLARVFKPSATQTRSELAYPVQFLGRIVWLLNLEDRLENGFTREAQRELASIVGNPGDGDSSGELQRILEKLFQRVIQGQILEAATHGIVVARQPGGIQFLNRKAETLLSGANGPDGKRRRRLVGRNLATFAADEDAQDALLNRRSVSNRPITLCGADGVVRKVLLSSTRLEEEYDHQVFFFQDVDELEWEADLGIMRQAMSSLAAQTRTPLSVAGRLLRKLTEEGSAERAGVLVERTLAQLRKVRITYDRIQESFSQERQRQVIEVRLDRLIEDQVRQISPLERSQVEVMHPTALRVAGDPDRLKFVLASLLEYLLRRSGGEGQIGVTARPDAASAILTIDGPHVPEPERVGPLDGAVQETRDVVEIATAAIRRIVEDEHGGVFRSEAADGRIAFRVELPLAGAAQTEVR